jgi:hypothetical protein
MKNEVAHYKESRTELALLRELVEEIKERRLRRSAILADATRRYSDLAAVRTSIAQIVATSIRTRMG